MTWKLSMLKENLKFSFQVFVRVASLWTPTTFRITKQCKFPDSKGFRPINELGKDGKPLSYPNGKPKLKVVSQKGEVLVGMKDGVEYVLRFGETYRGPEDDENSTGDSRYIYAYARVNESLLEQPVLEPVPAPLEIPNVDSNATVSPPANVDTNGSQGDTGEQGAKGEPSVPSITPPGPPPNFTPPDTPPGVTPPPPPPPEASLIQIPRNRKTLKPTASPRKKLTEMLKSHALMLQTHRNKESIRKR